MPLLSPQDADFLRDAFQAEMKSGVTLRLFTMGASPLIIPGRECPNCSETEALLQELVALSDKIKLEKHDFYSEADLARKAGIERIPAVAIAADGIDRVKFYGSPAGYEFATLVETILLHGRGSGGLAKSTVEALGLLETSVHLQVFVTPT